MNGASMPIAPMERITTDAMVPQRIRRRDGGTGRAGRLVEAGAAVALLMEHPRSTNTELDGGGGQDDEEQGDGDGRRVADLEVGERLLGQVHDHAAGGVARPAVGQHDDRLVDLERADDGDGDVEEDG